MAITIDPASKMLVVDGKKTYACGSYGLLADKTTGMAGNVPFTDAFLNANRDFTFSIQIGSTANYLATVVPAAAKSGIYWLKEAWNTITPGDAVQGALYNSPYRMGYIQKDEPEGATELALCQADYNEMKKNDASKLMVVGIWHITTLALPLADIIVWDLYPFSHGGWVDWTRDVALHAWEAQARDIIRQDMSRTKTIMFNVQTIAQDASLAGRVFEATTPAEIRAQTYTGICMNHHGVVFLHGMNWAKGLAYSTSLSAAAQGIAAEIKMLNEYLVQDTLAYFWKGANRNPGAVTLSNNPTQRASYTDVNDLSWILKPGLLIVVNKSTRLLKTNITIAGLKDPQITTTGLYLQGSGRAGQTIPIVNSSFSATFDPLAVHIYALNPIVEPPPTGETWQCRMPLDGTEVSNLGNTRPNPACLPQQPQSNPVLMGLMITGFGLVVKEIVEGK